VTQPKCWKCGSTQVLIKFVGYERAECVVECPEQHEHFEDVAQHDLECRVCGLQWRDGSGESAVAS
jgi:hypothetical protein